MSEAKKVNIIQPQPPFQTKMVCSNVDFLVAGAAMGVGKAQPLDCEVCTPFGFRRIGDLKVGDIISRVNGSSQRVIQIHERGCLDAVKIKFKDGRETVCALDHLWKVRKSGHFTARFRQNHDYSEHWEIMTTEQIIKHLNSSSKYTLYIPNCGEVQFTRANMSRDIHPYLLGCLLGDGCIVDYLYAPRLTSYDDEIIDKIAELGYTLESHESNKREFVIKDKEVKDALIRMKLWGCKSDSKHIPKRYLYSTIEDRIELLQGLFDTDGSVDKRGYIEYDTVSLQLAKDVAFLVRSFGGLCSISEKQGSYVKNRERILCHTVYRLYIRLINASRFFHLTRKSVKTKDVNRIGNGVFETAIVGYEMAGREEMRCISVSCPDNLYLTNDFIVTHNSFAALLMAAEPSLDPDFRMVYLRRNIGDLKVGGSGTDEAAKIYGHYATLKMSDSPRLLFPSGAYIDFTHMADQSPDKVLERIRGWQYGYIYIDEGTGFEWSTIRLLMSRNRSKGKYTGKIRLTCNPKRNHWLRYWVDWHVDEQGFPIPERDGIVRYFYITGDRVEDVVFGDSPEEVYQKCRKHIDPILRKMGGEHTYQNLIKTTTFYSGKLSDNAIMLKNNPGYMGSVAAMGDKQAKANLLGCWNVDDSDEDTPIIASKARAITENDPCMNGDMWITADLADVGKDNTIILAWNGFHIIDYCIIPKTTGRGNYEGIRRMQLKYSVADSHVIYDGQRAMYMPDYIPEAIPYISGYAPRGLYRLNFQRLKDECYMRLVNAINEGYISMSEEVANATYQHQKIRVPISILTEFVDECSVVRFKEVMGGKKALLTKKEMNSQLGHEGSMDWLDAMHMRFLPCLACEYGQEIEYGVQKHEEDDYDEYAETANIYDDSAWC